MTNEQAAERIRHLEEILGYVVRSWDALPGPQHYPTKRVQAWLVDDMAPAIQLSRNALKDEQVLRAQVPASAGNSRLIHSR